MSYTPYYPPCPWPEPWRGYYIDAYGVAVAHGFQGTPEEWLASLVGPTGPAGTGIEVLGQYDSLEELEQAVPAPEIGRTERKRNNEIQTCKGNRNKQEHFKRLL